MSQGMLQQTNRNKNEADVREEVAMPFLALLGYKGGTENDIRREFSLTYDRDFLGRKKKSDPKLRGRADYVLVVLGAGRWVLEVKAPTEEITQDVIDQAITYARHPEVSGTYAAILNGRRFVVFHNTQASSDQPRIDIEITTPEELAEALQGTLSPAAIRRDWKPPIVDLKKPLADGFRSAAEIRSGTITYSEFTWESNFPIPATNAAVVSESCKRMSGLIGSITGGRIWRDGNGTIRAQLNWASPHEDVQQFMLDKKLEDAEYISLDEMISSNPEKPTVFDVVDAIRIEKGETVFDTVRWQKTYIGISIAMNYHAQAVGYIKGNVFSGELQVEYEATFPHAPQMKLVMKGVGSFDVIIDDK